MEWFDDRAQYQVFASNGRDGWEWRPTDLPVHRFTAAATWQLPIGCDRPVRPAGGARLRDRRMAVTPAARYYSGRLLLFNQSLIVDGDPRIDNPTRDRWFDTTKFRGRQDSFTPRNSPWYWDGLVGPGVFLADMTLTKMFTLTSSYRVEARIEAYNAFNTIVWDNP